jgi:sugar fermentation stimulation protein A
MKTCWHEGAKVILSDFSHKSDRKLKYTLQAVEMDDGWVGVNTSNPNKAVENAINTGLIKELNGYEFLMPEVKISAKSRIDLMLWNKESEAQAPKFLKTARKAKTLKNNFSNRNQNQLCFIEVKNVTLLEKDGGISFPDAKTIRGQKHLLELMELQKAGYRAIILFFVERNSAKWMTTAGNIDPVYEKLLKQAVQNYKVEAIAIKANVKKDGLYFEQLLPVKI